MKQESGRHMETKQTSQMVTWLDEERRKDKALISKLEERAISQSAIIEDQARRIQKVEAELASVRNTVLPQSVIDEAINRIRAEVAAAVEQVNGRRETSEGELKRQRDTDREMTMRAIEEMRQEFVTRLERELSVRRQEEERLSRIATELQSYAGNLSKGLEEFERSLTFLEEQRRQDSRRLSDMSGEVVELAKRTEGGKQKIDLLEDLSRRNERSIAQVNSELTESKQQRLAWQEQEGLAAQQREQMMAEMVRRIEAFNETMDAHAKQVAGWADMHRTMKKQIEDFDRIADRSDRRLNEVAEVQRLSEERFRQEWEEWLQDDQKRWRQFTLTNEEARREMQRAMDEIQSQMAKQAELMQTFTEYIKRLRNNQQEMSKGIASLTQTLSETFQDSMNSLPPLS
jgi:hypothetical protein